MSEPALPTGWAIVACHAAAIKDTDPQTATALSLKLLTCDAACKREGGLKWWDTCVYTEGY